MRNLRSWIMRVYPAYGPPLVLLAACVLAFGLTIPWLGLYADDWPFVFVNHLAGLRGVVEFISWVRPVAAWFFASTAALIGTHFWIVHVLLLLLRWLDSILLWQVLRRAWPAQPQPALWASLLFAVYPAFKQQPLALEYVPHFVALGLLFASIWASLRLSEDPPLPRRQAVIVSVLAWIGSWQVFILEYFVGLELLRPLLLWINYSRHTDRKTALKRSIRAWVPYAAVLGLFVVWRVFVFGFPSYQPELISGLGQSPLAAAAQLGQAILHDLWTAGIAVWMQPFHLPAGGRTVLAWTGLVGLSLLFFAGALLVYARVHSPLSARSFTQARWQVEYIGAGLFTMLACGWPFWITHLPLSLDFPWDRTSLAFMVGACLLGAGLLGLLQLLPGRGLAPALAAAVLLAFSIGLHFQNANQYRKEWSILTPFYWQLTWRAPGLAPGATIVLDQTPFNYHVDKFLSPLLNWTYEPIASTKIQGSTLHTPYGLFDFHKMWGKTLPVESTPVPVQIDYGTLTFASDTSQLLVVVYDPPGCLRILTPDEQTHLLISSELKQTLPLTNLALIDPSPASPARPPEFLGPEPPHDWCYYFEKADLAQQFGDWEAIKAWGDEAFARGLSPRQPSELLVFVSGYARTGQWDTALKLSRQASEKGDFFKRAACATWERIGKEVDPSSAGIARVELGCK